MAFVLDASVTASWLFEDEDAADAREAFRRIATEEAVVPRLWWFEIRNILVVNERRGRITEADTTSFLRALSRLRVREDGAPNEDAVLRLARKRQLSVYDAAYLELALRERLELATLDDQLRHAALAERLSVVTSGPSR